MASQPTSTMQWQQWQQLWQWAHPQTVTEEMVTNKLFHLPPTRRSSHGYEGAVWAGSQYVLNREWSICAHIRTLVKTILTHLFSLVLYRPIIWQHRFHWGYWMRLKNPRWNIWLSSGYQPVDKGDIAGSAIHLLSNVWGGDCNYHDNWWLLVLFAASE